METLGTARTWESGIDYLSLENWGENKQKILC